MASQESIMIRQLLKASVAAQKPGQSLADARKGLEALTALNPLAQDLTVEKLTVEGMPAEWVSAPNATTDQVFLYLHGGAYIMGSCNTHRDLASKISRASGCRVLVIEYRLAPENPYPAAVEDALTAYRWLLSTGFSPNQVVIGGDSAGGGLTLSLLLSLKEAGEAQPAAAVLLSPWTDLAGTGASMESRAEVDPWLSPEPTRQTPSLYLGLTDRRNPIVSPIYADLQGLPPLFVQVGDHEILLDDAVRLVERAREAGVEVSFKIWGEMWHVFQQFNMPEAFEAIKEIGEFVKSKAQASV
ncbi:alpha/beta hydrolase [Mesobacillus maritimus]|uniref:alpha/beta hydrolase n=1 Tax=Mesobacillus maritimus TaxID=1643336 RepID=UPI00203A92BD|nr:alpha/beta hydrolase [Mesobacillus maritimus]MCM3585220.1 alpha/beta hydrolase [Mesobacillus maritimus]MCM3668111.1 alpha/beta hydrolase [Mesobacillus maritimus]